MSGLGGEKVSVLLVELVGLVKWGLVESLIDHLTEPFEAKPIEQGACPELCRRERFERLERIL